MENYKIKVNDEAESKEAQVLFEQLGFKNDCGDRFGLVYVIDNEIGTDLMQHWDYYSEKLCQELTLPQLRDLVVLHRNDVKDANCIDKKGESWYLTSEGKYYAWQYRAKRWDVESDSCIAAHDIKSIQKPHLEQGLISGADALKAMMEGKRVLYSGYGNQDWDTALNCNLGVFLKHEKFPDFTFKIVPKTIKLELEIPAPFEPKDDDRVWVLDVHRECGYGPLFFNSAEPKYTQFGAWRNEEEIKAVVAALRGIKG